ncbi:hypothetical protein TeGR_g14214, partial [Tetraparma gracilis]
MPSFLLLLLALLLQPSSPSSPPPLAPSIHLQNQRDHDAEIAKCSLEAFHGAIPPLVPRPAFSSLPVPGWRCPDFHAELRPPELVHTTRAPLFPSAECRALVEDVESFMSASPEGWSHIKAGRYAVHGGWVK